MASNAVSIDFDIIDLIWSSYMVKLVSLRVFLISCLAGLFLFFNVGVGAVGAQDNGKNNILLLQFPKQSVGKLHVVKNAEMTVDPLVEKASFAEALGMVRIPRQAKLKLILNENGCKKGALATFSDFPAGVIYSVDAGNLEAFDDTALFEVCRLRGLRELVALNTEITDAGLPAIKNQTSLEKLQLGETAITSKAINTLCNFKSLVVLNLHYTNMKTADFAALKDLTRLRVLNISHCQLDKNFLAQVCKIGSLQELVICGTSAVNDANIGQVKALSHLRSLNIRETAVTPAAIPVLKALKLTSLEVSFPPKAVSYLKKAMPGVYISSEGKPLLPADLFAPLH